MTMSVVLRGRLEFRVCLRSETLFRPLRAAVDQSFAVVVEAVADGAPKAAEGAAAIVVAAVVDTVAAAVGAAVGAAIGAAGADEAALKVAANADLIGGIDSMAAKDVWKEAAAAVDDADEVEGRDKSAAGIRRNEFSLGRAPNALVDGVAEATKGSRLGDEKEGERGAEDRDRASFIRFLTLSMIAFCEALMQLMSVSLVTNSCRIDLMDARVDARNCEFVTAPSSC